MTRMRAIAGRSSVVALLVGMLALIAGIGTSAAPASAHSAGKAVVLVRDFTLSPVKIPAAPAKATKATTAKGKAAATGTAAAATDGWQATVAIADFDSGAPLQGTAVTVGIADPNSTAPATKFVDLEPTSLIGQYQATVGSVAPGPARFELRVRTVPGSPPVQPYDRSYPVTLAAGQPVHVVTASGGGGGGSSLPMILSVAAVVLVGAMLYGLFSVRRRTAVPAATKSSGSPVRSAPAK